MRKYRHIILDIAVLTYYKDGHPTFGTTVGYSKFGG
jgi:hypothetical protein